ncbi:helix-turn-helix transcriptional regulator [Streptomyces murinus]|uniref:helix-turn-helix domain-containing protein n=1 Tax=Streptomyces murinus TaxID=33900 RepID=UPI003406E16D
MTRATQPRQGQVSTVLARRLGGELLRLRDAAGKTQQQAAESINATGTKIVKMERGWVPMRDPDIRVLCEFYGLDDPKVLARLLGLAQLDRERRKSKGWWRGTVGPGAVTEYIAMEDAATRIRNWQSSLIPGLLQIPQYTRALGVADAGWEDPEDIERAVTVKQKRQERLLGERPIQLHAVIWEAALRQEIGGPQVRRAQLQRLLELAELPNVCLQVLPFRTGAHPCITGPFSILSFAEDDALDVVQSDGVTDMVWVENEAESRTYGDLFDRTSRLSLAPCDSVTMVDDLIKEG